MNHKHQAFVTQYLKFGDQVHAYKLAYKSKADYKSLQSSANRLLNRPEIAQAIYDAEIRIRTDVEQKIAAERAREFFTIEEKLNLLHDIATGNIRVERNYKGKNCSQCTTYDTPSINQRLAAIRDHSKLAGHYPYKQNGKWVIPALREQQEQNTIPPSKEVPRKRGAEDVHTQHEEPNTENKNVIPCPDTGSQETPSNNTEEKPNTEILQQNTTTTELSPAGGGGEVRAGGGTLAQNNSPGAFPAQCGKGGVAPVAGRRMSAREEPNTENKNVIPCPDTGPQETPLNNTEEKPNTEILQQNTTTEPETGLSASGVRIGGQTNNTEKLQQNTTTEHGQTTSIHKKNTTSVPRNHSPANLSPC